MRELVCPNLVVGSGCAGLNAADWLAALGQEVLLITEGMNCGTSRNTGSDKQTYYKLSLAGDDGDSVGEMARTLAGPDVDGDIALCEAAGSARAFFKLVGLGVPFPDNEMGEYVGYQTDHDTRRRATSAGPLTSRYMTEALEKSVRARGVPVLDHTLAFEILRDDAGLAGLLCLDRRSGEVFAVRCANLILATGGPAGIYADRVYPASQFGMSGMAFAAGCRGANLHCWQYGLASVGFRWNVSGSYQQAIPRYVSVDQAGVEREFLAEALGPAAAADMTFLKGYQWPFDPARAQGSSRVDILVKAETDRGRRVYMDYRRNPAGYDPAALCAEARAYLQACGALDGATPLQRLAAINAPAIGLYRSHGIDLAARMLEVRVCAQHHNGGVGVDSHWQTDLPGLYVCGEAAGTFGARRPGGTALNSTQVGSLRAVQQILRSRRPLPARLPALPALRLPAGDAGATLAELQQAMTRHAAFLRDEGGIRALLGRLDALEAAALPFDPAAPVSGPKEAVDRERRLRLRDMMVTQRQVLSAMLLENEPGEPGVIETRGGVSRRRPARPIPDRDLWFERVWRARREEEVCDNET